MRSFNRSSLQTALGTFAKLIGSVGFALLLFQNCGPAFLGGAENGNGNGYGGMQIGQQPPAAQPGDVRATDRDFVIDGALDGSPICTDGNAHQAVLHLSSNSGWSLTRDGCQAVGPTPVDIDAVTWLSATSVRYQNRVFNEVVLP